MSININTLIFWLKNQIRAFVLQMLHLLHLRPNQPLLLLNP